LRESGCEVFVHDPLADPLEARHEYGINLLPWEELPQADALVLCVPHADYLAMPVGDYLEKVVQGGGIADVKSVLDRAALETAGLRVWRL